MPFSDSAKRLYREWQPLAAGWHRFRVVGARSRVAALKGCDGLEVIFECVDAPHSGARVPRTFWFSERSVGRSKEVLQLMFGERDLDEIENSEDFREIPVVWARVDHRDWDGDQILDLAAIRLDRPEEVPDQSDQGA